MQKIRRKGRGEDLLKDTDNSSDIRHHPENSHNITDKKREKQPKSTGITLLFPGRIRFSAYFRHVLSRSGIPIYIISIL